MPPATDLRPARPTIGVAPGLAVLAGWAIAVPWLARIVGLEVDVPTRLEVIDHVAPGLVVLACAAVLHRRRRHVPAAATARLVALAAACLAGAWITATHLTLVPEALDGVTGWGPALVHLSAGPPILGLALVVLATEP